MGKIIIDVDVGEETEHIAGVISEKMDEILKESLGNDIPEGIPKKEIIWLWGEKEDECFSDIKDYIEEMSKVEKQIIWRCDKCDLEVFSKSDAKECCENNEPTKKMYFYCKGCGEWWDNKQLAFDCPCSNEPNSDSSYEK